MSYKHLLPPGFTAQEFGCTCNLNPDHEYSIGFTDCWQLFLEWRVRVKDADFGSTADYIAQEALKQCLLHGKPLQVEPIPSDYPWTPAEFVVIV